MQVLKDHQQWLSSGEAFELPQQRCQRAFLFVLRAQIEPREPLASWHRQQFQQQGDVAAFGSRFKRGHKLVELLEAVVTRETSCAFELDDKGMERAVLMMRRTEITQTNMGLVFDAFGERRREARLADARLARDQHHSSVAALPLLPASDKQLDFLRTTDERRLSRAQCLEPAYLTTLTQHPPGAL